MSSSSSIKKSTGVPKETITLTFGDFAENHKGMEKIGKDIERGLNLEELKEAQKYFEEKGFKTHLVNLKKLLDGVKLEKPADDAYLLVIKNGINAIVSGDELFLEQDILEKDSKAFMYGRVVNKKARHNLCFSDFSQQPDYASGKGTVYDFKDLPLLNKTREEFPKIIKSVLVEKLQCEGNYYYDVDKTFIGFHGDTERKIVIAVRLGADFNIYYQWYYKNQPVGNLFCYTLNHADIYFMGDKTVGYDWKSSSKYTLRHAAANNFKLIAPK